MSVPLSHPESALVQRRNAFATASQKVLSWFLTTACLTLVGVLFSGLDTAQAGTWKPLKNPAPKGPIHFVLLFDGSVLGFAQEGLVRLSPDAQGHYLNGTWSLPNPLHEVRTLHGSVVLPNGNVFAVGGEYGTGIGNCEIFDPVANTSRRTSAPPPGGDVLGTPFSNLNIFSDCMAMLISEDDILIAPSAPAIENTSLVYHIKSDTWSTVPLVPQPISEGKSTQLEANWVKLRDDSVLTINYLSTNTQRFIPSQNRWVEDSPTPVSIMGDGVYTPGGGLYEPGPGFLLPDGRAFFIGGNGKTVLYTPSGGEAKGTWVAGPSMPDGVGSPDGAGVTLPNGKILFIATTYNVKPSYFFEYDPFSNSIHPVNSPIGPVWSSGPGEVTMLPLPDGTVLVQGNQSSPQPYIYTPDGVPLAEGKPTILGIARNGEGSYTVTGKLLNGISEGGSYGDDAQMASNYPIIAFKNSLGQVWYARTLKISSSSVQTGDRVLTADFELPGGLSAGSYSVSVVANGIPSNPVPFDAPATPLPSVRGASAAAVDSSTVRVTWNSLRNSETGYEIQRSLDGKVFAKIAQVGPSAVSYLDSTATPLTRFYYRVVGINDLGPGGTEGIAAVGTPHSSPLPQDWNSQNLGAVTGNGGSGISVQTSGQEITVMGAGRPFEDRVDQCQFLSKSIQGDRVFTARVASFDSSVPGAAAGLMFRTDESPESAHVALLRTSDRGLILQSRRLFNSPVDVVPTAEFTGVANWLRLVRFGDVFVAYGSVEGVSWTRLAAVSVPMPNGIRAGFVANGGSQSSMAFARFADVGIEELPRILTRSQPADCREVIPDPAVQQGALASRLAANLHRGVALLRGGSLLGWSGLSSEESSFGDVSSGFASIACGGNFLVAIRSTGFAVGAGDNQYGQAQPPTTNRFHSLAAGATHAVGIRNIDSPWEGPVVQWGDSTHGQGAVPKDLRATLVAAGAHHSLALSVPGAFVSKVFAWGDNSSGQTTVPFIPSPVGIAAGGSHSLAVTAGGTVVGWGDNRYGQATPPPGITNAIAVAAGANHSLALLRNGRVVGWGENSRIPDAATNVVAIAAGENLSAALTEDGRVIRWGNELQLELFSDGVRLHDLDTVPVAAPLTLTATPTGACSPALSRVEFYDGDSLLGSSSAPPYSMSWNVPSAGTHRVRAVLVDGLGSDTGAAVTLQALGRAGNAIRFNGGADQITVTPGPVLANGSFTVEAWLKVAAGDGHNFFLMQGDGGFDATLHLGFRSGKSPDFAFGGDDLVAADPVGDEGWHHWAFTYSAADGRRIIYRDGFEVASDTSVGPYTGSGTLYVGAAPLIPSAFRGAMDELRIWNYARNPNEIRFNLNRLMTGREIGLVANWRFDALTDNTIVDEVAGRTGSITGHPDAIPSTLGLDVPLIGPIKPLVGWTPDPLVFGIALGSAQLNARAGVPGSFAYTPPAGTVLPVGPQTISAVFTPVDSIHFQTVTITAEVKVSKALPKITWNPASPLTYGTGLGAGQLNASADVPGTFTYSPAQGTLLAAGGRQLSVVFEPADASRYQKATASVAVLVNPAPLIIKAEDRSVVVGKEPSGYTAQYLGLVNGQTPSDLATPPQLASTGGRSSAPGNYPITPFGAYDPNYQISYQNGTLSIVQGGTAGTALALDGVDGRAEVTAPPSLANKSFTIEAWVRPLVHNRHNFFLMQGDGGTDRTLHIGFKDNNTVDFAFGGDDLVSTDVFTDSEWHHWAFTFDVSTRTRVIYRDGVRVASDVARQAYQGTGKLILGAVPLLPSYFNGSMDEVRIWNVARTDEEIRSNGNRMIESGTPNLIALWRFDEGAGANSLDASGSALATLVGGTTWIRSGVTLTPSISGPVAPAIKWSPTGPITYGSPLGANQLNARASTEGSFSYTPALGSIPVAGRVILDSTFVPNDPVLYSSVSTNVTLVVNPATLIVQANEQTMVEGGAVPVLTSTITGFVNGDTAASLTAPVSLSTSATSSSPVGTYPIVASAASSPNYVFTYRPGKLTISPRPNRDPVLNQVNPLAGPYQNQPFTLSYEALAAASDASDADGNAISFRVVAVLAGAFTLDGVPVVPNQTLLAAGQRLLWTPPAGKAGRLAALVVRAWDGRSGSASDVTVAIDVVPPAAPVIDWKQPASIVYGSPLGVAQLNATASVPGSFAYAPALGAVLGAGSRTLSVTFTPADPIRYSIATSTVTLAVDRASLVVQPDDKSMNAGEAVPALTARYVGFVNGDTVAALDAVPKLTTSVTAASVPGTYEITASGGAASNYTFDFRTGKLTVNNAPKPAPTALAQSLETAVHRPLNLELHGTADAGVSLKYRLVSSPSHGKISGQPPRLLYVSADHFIGEDAFSFVVSADGVESKPATVSIAVKGPEFHASGKALLLDGINDSVVVDGSINLSNRSFTIEAWVRSTAQNINNFFFLQGDGSQNRTLHIGFRANNIPTFAFGGNDLNTPQAYTDQGWHHWAFTFSSGNRARRIYRDGVLVASDTAASAYTGSGKFYIGSAPLVPSYFKGSMDEVRIWSVVRSEAEIQSNFRTTLTGTEPNLIAYWNFDEGSGSSAKALGRDGAALTGVLQGGVGWTESAVDLSLPAPTLAGVTDAPAAGGVVLSFTGVEGAVYQIESSADLLSWEIVGASSPTANGGQEFRASTTDQSSGFFRVRIP